ncbi:hypothetical protein [Nocardia cyriacigeorgica]|uniref:hypothetical protein n=1 Tax=Nocardia cyriacigeorgica TaxID=135487 RepID=UPI0018930D7D|nr:hypothetical protein [Nocardia cyriacigeorgica]MBF6089459.1 hypothetical protein [Nocardia cyriacigeorgica]MBF6094585.1 hypothetical protein [Nocardia cyriacigeorgica]MBF6101979.1 hypothetical protein [Nocardia cyriacigeorgica]MBF6158834.1 hypothetical protein [Nocardia cyriacigeorgica]MBF6197480.1 hypothetical protein [Nocardia cyriacigeorgica]
MVSSEALPPTYREAAPANFKTTAQLRADGLVPGNPQRPVAYLEKLIDGDIWRTELYDTTTAVSMHQSADSGTETIPQPSVETERLAVIRWTRRSRLLVGGQYVEREKPTKNHVTLDGTKTVCGAKIPGTAVTVTARSDEWHLQANCYNCVYRLWDSHAPEGYCRPSSGQDFPLTRACEHGRRPRTCMKCSPPKSWSCPNGCTEPHDPLARYPRCTVFPPHREVPEGERCPEGTCESTERALKRANPGLFLDLADSASMTCYHCYNSVCVNCERNPVDGPLTFCDPCAEAEVHNLQMLDADGL